MSQSTKNPSAPSKHSTKSNIQTKDFDNADTQESLDEANANHGRGGKRKGSGRPTGTGKYGEPTKAIRVPEGSIVHIKSFLKDEYSKLSNISDNNSSDDNNSLVEGGTSQTNSQNNNQNNKSNVSILKSSYDWTNSDPSQSEKIPLFSTKVAAGIPTMADDHLEESLDLNEYLVEHPKSTFMLKVEGESMKDAGILPDDILIVDRSIKAKHNKIIIAALDGELTVKRLYRRAGELKLLPENPDYPEIAIRREADLVIWGVVIGSFRRFQKNSFF